MDEELPLDDDERECLEDHGLEVRFVDGVLEGLFEGRWLPVDRSDLERGRPPAPTGTDLGWADYADGTAYLSMRKVTDSLLWWRWGGFDDWETWVEDFEPGTERQQIDGFVSYVRELYPDGPTFVVTTPMPTVDPTSR